MVSETRVEPRIVILGLGEAGGRLAADLVELGLDPVGFDPLADTSVPGLRLAGSLREAVALGDVVLSVNSASVALAVARDAAGALRGGALFADLNTAAPTLKEALAAAVGKAGVPFADVALLAPVPRGGLRTPALASGDGAIAFAEIFGPLGMPVEVLGIEPGLAAQRKLLRSVFMKGLAASIVESLEGAEAAGCEEWLRTSIVSVLESADGALFERLVGGSRVHAARRVEEMEAACDLLRELGVEPRVAAAAAAQLSALALGRDKARSG